MFEVIFRPSGRAATPPPTPPAYDTTVNFQVSTRPPVNFDKGLMKMSPANLPEFDKLEIYSKDAGGNIMGLWCDCYGVPTNTGLGTQCSGAQNAQNGVSYEVRFYKNNSLVHTATAVINGLYDEHFVVDYWPQQESTDWEYKAKIQVGNWPAGCSGMVTSYDPTFPMGDDCFEIPAAAMASGAEVVIDLINDPTFYGGWAIVAMDGPKAIYQCRIDLIVHEPY